MGGLVAWAIVRSGLLDKVDARLARRGANARAFVAGIVYFLAASLVTLPWALYTDWWREQDYGRTSQPLGDFLGQAALSTLISSVIGALFFVGVYALIRRTGARWWLWSGGLTALALSALMLVAPIAIEPLFNDYKPVPPGEVRAALEAMARSAASRPTACSSTTARGSRTTSPPTSPAWAGRRGSRSPTSPSRAPRWTR